MKANLHARDNWFYVSLDKYSAIDRKCAQLVQLNDRVQLAKQLKMHHNKTIEMDSAVGKTYE